MSETPGSEILRDLKTRQFNPANRPVVKWYHPRVKINLSNLTITVNGDYPYEIDLERWTHSAAVLDTILQVARKPWCDAELLRQLIEAINHACRMIFDQCAQGVFCPYGREMRGISWATGERERATNV